MGSRVNGAGAELHENPDTKSRSDAGLRSLDHYQRKLPPWRYNLRQRFLPVIRCETPYLAWLQDKTRCSALDRYFAITANLGTHTCFMIGLPILFWCGQTSLGRGMVHILQMGVFFTGFIKDMLSLPRPLSPPLHRITMSGSAALEYGFPSTHSTNAVSVATYALLLVNSPDSDLTPSTKLLLQFVFCCYAVSIVLGRLYCGMHGFLDVFMGSTMGALLSIIDYTYVPKIDAYWYSSSWLAMAIMVLVIFALIRVHPEPADDCPCFDDSVSSAGVMIGCEVGGWHYAAGNWAWSSPVPASVPFDFEYLGWGIIGARIVVGILVIFAWRDVMKRILLKNLPPLFRIIEKCGLDWPRKHFTPASEYSFIPGRLKMDNTLPSLSDIPGFLKSMRHPGRGRGDSVGPQSAADAYEAIAYREKRRRDSLSSIVDENEVVSHVNGFSIIPGTPQITTDTAVSSAVQPKSFGIMSDNSLPTPAQSRVGSYEHMMGQGFVAAPATPPESDKDDAYDGSEIIVGERNAAEEEEIFSKLEKPRVRYDVEVVTKLVVYTGIGWLSVETIPIIFEIIGLGMGSERKR